MSKYSNLFKLMFRVKNLQKAQGRVEAVRGTLGIDVDVKECKQYWKLPELWECQLTTPAREKTIPHAVFECLLLSHKLGNGWYILGPLIHDGALTFFNGIVSVTQASTPYIAGFEWGEFNIEFHPPNEEAERISGAK